MPFRCKRNNSKLSKILASFYLGGRVSSPTRPPAYEKKTHPHVTRPEIPLESELVTGASRVPAWMNGLELIWFACYSSFPGRSRMPLPNKCRMSIFDFGSEIRRPTWQLGGSVLALVRFTSEASTYMSLGVLS